MKRVELPIKTVKIADRIINSRYHSYKTGLYDRLTREEYNYQGVIDIIPSGKMIFLKVDALDTRRLQYLWEKKECKYIIERKYERSVRVLDVSGDIKQINEFDYPDYLLPINNTKVLLKNYNIGKRVYECAIIDILTSEKREYPADYMNPRPFINNTILYIEYDVEEKEPYTLLTEYDVNTGKLLRKSEITSKITSLAFAYKDDNNYYTLATTHNNVILYESCETGCKEIFRTQLQYCLVENYIPNRFLIVETESNTYTLSVNEMKMVEVFNHKIEDILYLPIMFMPNRENHHIVTDIGDKLVAIESETIFISFNTSEERLELLCTCIVFLSDYISSRDIIRMIFMCLNN